MVAPIALSALLVGCTTNDSAYNDSDKLAKVGKYTITQGEVTNYLLDLHSSYGLDALITNKLVELEAKEYKVKVTKEEIDKEYAALEEQKGGKEAFEQAMEQEGLTKEIVRKNLESSLLTKKTLEKYLDPQEKDIKAYFDENKKEYDTPAQVKASHILVKDEKTAKEIIKELDESKDIKKTFAELAKKHSEDDSNKDEGGDLGFFAEGEMIEEFEKAAFDMKKGTYSKEPVKTSYGYHIIYKTDEKEAEKAVYEDIKDTVYEDYLTETMNEVYNDWLDEITEKHGVTIF